MTPDPFEQKSLGFSYGLAGDRTSFIAGFEVGEEDYAGGLVIDNDYQSSNLTVDYRVTQRLNVGLSYNRYNRDYQETTAPSPSQEDRTAGVRMNLTIGRQFSIALDVSRYEATGNQLVEETRSEFRFAYSPTGDTPRALASIGR